jgi:hypothetical protein
LALTKAQEEDSVFRIKSAEDVYNVLTDKETLEKVLLQGLKEEHAIQGQHSRVFHEYERQNQNRRLESLLASNTAGNIPNKPR